MQKGNKKRQLRKPQHQQRPGSEQKLEPQPVFDYPEKGGSNKLKGKIALITGVTGFGIIAGSAAVIAQTIFFISIVMLLVSLLSTPPPTRSIDS